MRISIFLWLISALPGRQINARRQDAPIITAIKNGNENIIQDLIDDGADVNIANEDGNIPLHIAASNDLPTVVELLLRNGASVNAVNKLGYTPLYVAAVNGYEKIVELLIHNGASVNFVDKEGYSPLFSVISGGDDKMVELLAYNGASVNVVNGQLMDTPTPLHLAAVKGYEKIVEILIHNGANVNSLNKDGNTPLHMAAHNGKDKVVEILLRNGANRKVTNQKKQTARNLAREKGYSKILDLLRKTFTAQNACDSYSNLQTDDTLNDDPAEAAEFPWMVALGYVDEKNKINFKCVGTIISNFFILTAAHCTTLARQLSVVRIGLNLIDDDMMNPNSPQNHNIEQIIRHPNYSSTSSKNDIALIRVTRSIEFSEFSRPACLQTLSSDINPKANLIVTGWGMISTARRNRSNVLLKANMTTLPLEECNSTIFEYNQHPNGASFRNGVSESQYCARDVRMKSDSCQGYNGGPLQIYRSDSKIAKIVGIVSFSTGCETDRLPSIFTRVSYYLDWIESNVWPNGVNSTFN
ncbi:melanization protease 1-like [Contarinia nasturtii]|uniref:melanization protease 1-like n=1 Tax=Contarinia nasturtii TaxID=265458 RepID=UPI0012D45A2C|nr:melanization protease 1-like [Contarinia nasturtii]